MKLREICERTGISKRNIHFYIKEGLLTPKQDPANGYYDFSEEDIISLTLIRNLRNGGFSISQIGQILQTPSTSVYYMNQRLKQIRKELTNLSALEEAISYMQQNLPLHPVLQDLDELVQKANIPSPIQDMGSDDQPADNDISLVNRYLWESFLPDSPLSEYQEFLWSKINHISAASCEEDYRLLSRTLHSFPDAQIKMVFADNRKVHEEVIHLTMEQYPLYSEKMVNAIRLFLDHSRSVNRWKSLYNNFLAPTTRLYDSSIAAIMDELSPLYASYRRNVHAVCQITYDWLHSPEGTPLLEKMKDILHDQFDIDHDHHGQLQAMASEYIIK